MTMHYADDTGHGLLHINDDTDEWRTSESHVAYKGEEGWTSEQVAVAEKLADYFGVPSCARTWKKEARK